MVTNGIWISGPDKLKVTLKKNLSERSKESIIVPPPELKTLLKTRLKTFLKSRGFQVLFFSFGFLNFTKDCIAHNALKTIIISVKF